MKEQSKFSKVLSILLSVVLVISSFYLLYQVIRLNVLPSKFLFPLTIGVVVLDGIFVLLLAYFNKNFVSKIICVVLTLLVCTASCFGGYYISKTHSVLSNITNVTKHAKNTVSVIVKESSSIKNKSQLNGVSVGSLRLNEQGSKKALKELSKDGIVLNQTEYDSLSALLEAFYNGQVDSIIINESSRSQILDMEAYSNFDSNTRVVYQTSYKVKNNDSATSVSDITSKPFNVLISGSDTRGGFDENGRSDVIMVATVNPKSHTILLTSIPRDFYVTTACDAGDGCQEGALDKITHTGIHGTNTTKRTVEKLLGIEINYTFKVGFDTVTELVDVLGGVDVYVEPGYATTTSSFSVHEGLNHLNGQQALAYARERYSYEEGDRQRTKNQQQVLMGIVREATKPSVITNYAAIMDSMANTFSTTMSNDEITDLIKYQLNNNPTWNMEQYMVDGTGDTLMCAELGDAASVMVPDQSTVKLAKDKISAVLAGKSSTEVQ